MRTQGVRYLCVMEIYIYKFLLTFQQTLDQKLILPAQLTGWQN